MPQVWYILSLLFSWFFGFLILCRNVGCNEMNWEELTLVPCYNQDTFVADLCAMLHKGCFCCWQLWHVTTRILFLLMLVPCYKLQQGYLCCWHLCHVTTRILVLLTLVPCHNQDIFVTTRIPVYNTDSYVADTCAMLQSGYFCCWRLYHVTS